MTEKNSLFFEYVIFFFTLAFSLILAFGGNFSSTVSEGIKLWAFCLVPSLLPYFFITAVLSSLNVTEKLASFFSPVTKRLFNVGGLSGYAFFMSFVSGYPVGAKVVSDLKTNGLIGESESVRASVLCSTSSPAFLIVTVGSVMMGNYKFGLLLFLTHFLSAFIIGFAVSFYKRKDKPQTLSVYAPKNTDNLLYESVYSAVISVIVVGGLITVFYTVTGILSYYNLLSPVEKLFSFLLKDECLGRGLTLGIFESTNGLKTVAEGGIKFLSLPVCSAICGFGGLSVIAQSTAYLKRAKIKTGIFYLFKVISAVLNFFSGLLFSALFL